MKRVRVAIVDDDILLCNSLAFFLREKGCVVEPLGSAEEAGDVVESGGFDIVISDYKLPGEDGLSFLRRVLASRKTVGTILISAHGGEDVREEAFLAGVGSYLPKPFSIEELEIALHRSLGNRGYGRDGIAGANG